MSAGEFLTIAGRWQQHVAASGLDTKLPRREQGLAMLMFYAGFSASLEATMQVAEFPEDQAMQLLAALHKEVQQVEAMATRILGGTGFQS